MEEINIGGKIKEFRTKKGMSLRELAEKTGISPSMISQIENNCANPSINTLRQIASELEVPIYSFFRSDEARDALVVRKGEYKLLGKEDTEVRYKLLTQDVSGSLECCLMELPGGKASAQKAYGHEGEEVAYVIDGKVDIYIDEVLYTLNEGDAVKVPSMARHVWVNKYEGTATVVFAVTPPGF